VTTRTMPKLPQKLFAANATRRRKKSPKIKKKFSIALKVNLKYKMVDFFWCFS